MDVLENIGQYASLGKPFAAAAAFLSTADLAALPPGRTPIDGDRVFALKSETRLERDTMAWEAHGRYADIQMILQGRERFGWGVAEGYGAYNAEGDFLPCVNVTGFSFILTPRQFAVFLPGEPHAPGNYVEKGDVSTKVIIKVSMDQDC